MYQKVSVTFSFAATKKYYSIRTARLQCSSGPFMLLLLEEERRGRNADGLPSAIEWRTIGCCDTTTTRLNGFDVAPCWFKSAPSNAFRRIFADFQVIRCFSTTQLISGSCSIVGLPVLVAWSNVPRYSFTIFCWKPLKPMGRCAVIIFASPVDKWEIRVTSVLCERPIWDFALASGRNFVHVRPLFKLWLNVEKMSLSHCGWCSRRHFHSVCRKNRLEMRSKMPTVARQVSSGRRSRQLRALNAMGRAANCWEYSAANVP